MTKMRIHSKRAAELLMTLLLPFGCAGRGQSTSAATPAADPPAAPAATSPATSSADSLSWLVADSATRTATLTLEVTRPAGSPSALINGYRAGQAQVVVPLGWTVRWNWRNADQSSPHSLVLMVQREKIPLEGGRPAFSNAMTRSATEGLGPGQTDQTTFEAEEAGWYWLLCGVPAHAVEGEWLELRVDPEARTARVQLKPKR
jgi:Sulfocyanin (SoxE) domain